MLPLFAGALAATPPSTPVVSCPFQGTAGTSTFHGFYVTAYAGNNLGTVTLAYSTNTPGRFSISLTARRGSFDGPMIGVTQTATVDIGSAAETQVTFDFSGAPVSPGDTIAFTQSAGQLSSLNDQYGSLYADAGSPSCAHLFQTQTTSPPLDTVIANGMGVTIGQENLTGLGPACVGSDTVLCLDDRPGDRRFAVRASFHTSQSGGVTGDAQAISLAQLGANRGGVLWFFSPDN
ncbi:MAG TPA: hypothetical protein VGE98_11630, partial [Thermoanaerobaculia bacterium]